MSAALETSELADVGIGLVEEKHKTKETSPDSKASLREALRPDEQFAERIRTRVAETAFDIVTEDSNPEMIRVMQTATGIFLWEQMAVDRGQSLPVGLAFDNSNKSYRRPFNEVVFDNDIITRREYEFAIELFKDRGLIDEVTAIQNEYRAQHKEEIASSIENFIHDSPLTEFFDSFDIQSREELSEQDIRPQDELTIKATLESAFSIKYSQLLKGQSVERSLRSYMQVLRAYPYEVEEAIALQRETQPLSPEEEAKLRTQLTVTFDEKWSHITGSPPRESVPVRYLVSLRQDLGTAYSNEVEKYIDKKLPEEEANTAREQLETTFKEKWRDELGSISVTFENARNAHHILPLVYDQEVTKPLYLATSQRPQESKSKYPTDRVREGFNQFLPLNYYYDTKNTGYVSAMTLEEFQRRLTVDDGKFALHYNAGELFDSNDKPIPDEMTLKTGGWDNYFTYFCINQFNADPYWFNAQYGIRALALIGPRLYDVRDKRNAQVIIDEGIKEVSQILTQEFIDEPYTSLTQANFSVQDNASRVIWLHNALGPIADESTRKEPRVETYWGWRGYHRSNLLGEKDQKKRQTRKLCDTVAANPKVFTPTRLFHIKAFNEDVPTVPTENPDLIIDNVSNALKGNGIYNDKQKYDPSINGMTLIARDGNRYYYKIDAQDSRYDRVDKEIQYVNRQAISEFCKKVGMQSLSAQIKASDGLTLSQLVDLIQEHTVEYLPYDYTTIQAEGTKGWLLDKNGNLLGYPAIFNHFLSTVLHLIYDRDKIGNDIGYGISAQNNTDRTLLYQTTLKVPEEGIDCIFTITPPNQQIELPPPRIERDIVSDDTISIESAKELEKKRNQKLAVIKFAEPEVFNGVSQRLITSVARNDQLPHARLFAEKNVVLRLKCFGTTLADTTHDPYIEGLRLVARNDQEQTFDFALDETSIVYKPVREKIPQTRQIMLAKICLAMGMKDMAGELAQNAHDGKEITIEELRLLARDNVIYWIPDGNEEKPPFKVDSLMDLANNGLVDEQGMLRGQCDTFEFFMRKMLEIANPDALIKGISGYSLSLTLYVDAQSHGQTDYNGYLIDIEPNPRRADIGNYSNSAVPVMNRRRFNDSTLQWLSRISFVQSQGKDTTGDDSESETSADIQSIVETINNGTSGENGSEQEQKADNFIELENTTKIAKKTEKKLTSIDEFEIPAPEPFEETAGETFKTESIKKKFEATVALFDKEIFTYLGLPVDLFHKNETREKILQAFKSDIATYNLQDVNSISHIQLWRLLDQYQQWRYPNPLESQDRPETFSTPEDIDIATLKKWLGFYKERGAGLTDLIRRKKLPDYDQRFLGTMDQLVTTFSEWQQAQALAA